MRWKKQKELPRRRLVSDDQTRHEKRQSTTLFKRNRTLTGTSSATVTSANELSGDLRSPRVHVHHLTAHRRRLSTILTMVLIASALLTWLLYEFTATVNVAPTDSSALIQQDRYRKVIDDYFAVHPIERLRFLTNNEQLSMYVARHAPEVQSIAVTGSSGFASSQFDLTLREPTVSWLIGNTQYYVDSTGVAFQINYFDAPTVKIIDRSGVPQTAGTTIASSRFLSFVGRAVAVAKDFGLTIEQAVLPPESTRQIELKAVGHPYAVKVSLDRPVGEQIEDMQRSIAYFDSKKLTPKYIDVRVSGRAFYQ